MVGSSKGVEEMLAGGACRGMGVEPGVLVLAKDDLDVRLRPLLMVLMRLRKRLVRLVLGGSSSQTETASWGIVGVRKPGVANWGVVC